MFTSMLSAICLAGMLAIASAFERVPGNYAKHENPNPVSSNLNCSYGSSVDALPIYAGIKDLYRIDGELCHAPGGFPGQGNGGCAMMTCANSSSIWLCNDKPSYLSVPCKYVAEYVF
ncbi:hypothetical protein F503_05530 [Ophiostoma piceae UAMH 11346]|uniref:Uncharacterized protein n=1 Tax=Ophiostoma piceae (strain UAMH 11346) TaxID=1262450 RepID=S3DA77_OPHP1|nr:hypothetical protein F503_05530 [Ophiostoma piceae UAMH 11346]